jgi:hypothetical protein
VPPYAVVEGAPARIVRMRFDEATIARLRALAWWRYCLFQLPSGLSRHVPDFLDHLEQAVRNGAIEPYESGWFGPPDLLDLALHPG